MTPQTSCWVLLTGLCFILTACDRTDQLVSSKPGDGKTKAVGSKLTALQIIDGCKQAYQSLDSYEDEGFVRLKYDLNGKATEDRAPLSVAFQRPSMLGVLAYGVQAGPKGGRWRLKLADSDRSAVAGQVVSRTLPPKADLVWLLSDPSISDELAAGLAGFPPQLDVLLAPEPMRGLINESATLALDTPEKLEGTPCHVVRVIRAGMVYRLWIDQASLLLKRVEIPNANLTPEMLADPSVSNVQLTIELAKVKTNTAIDWKRFEVSIQPDAKLVSRFVPAPPPLPTDKLGVQVPGFLLRNADEKVVFSSADSSTVNVLVWLADHPACRSAADQMSQIASAVENGPYKRRVKFVCIWAEPEPPKDSSFEQLMTTWKLPGVLALDKEAIGRDLFDVREAPTIVVLDSSNHLQVYEERSNPYLVQLLPELLGRLVAGENLAVEVTRTAELERRRHVSELLMSASVDADRQNFEQPNSYATRTISLAKSKHQIPIPADEQVVALNVDDALMIWTLTSDGRLRKEDPSNQTSMVYRTPWKLNRNAPARLEISPGGQYVAIIQYGDHRIDMFDTTIEQNRDVQLNDIEAVVDCAWVTLAGSKSPRLAVVTSDNETKLLDPNNHEQLSGRCPSEPLAIISHSSRESQIGGVVVLADRSIENLQVSPDAAYQTTLELGRPAAHRKPVAEANPPITATNIPKRLTFQPAAGPWKSVGADNNFITLARGWLAQDEPAVFMLDSKLRQLWSYRMPLVTDKNAIQMSTACIDPNTGQPLWALCHASQTIHLLRGDGVVTDHLQLEDPIRGIGLVSDGNRLALYVAHPNEVAKYTVNAAANF